MIKIPKRNELYFTGSDLRNRILCIGEHEHKIYMPNEIFSELINGFTNDKGELVQGFLDEDGKKIKEFTSSTHIAYAYSYVYLAHYMYRYCKYYYDGAKDIDEKMIKQILGFPAKSDSYTYITKKGGLLERMGYIRKESDKPIRPILEETSPELSEFLMESNYSELFGYNRRNRKINFPVKAFHREAWAEEDNYFNGTFFNVLNTHKINIEIFIYCMTDPELGVKGFYLYCFMLYNNDKFNNGFNCSFEKLASLTGLSIKTIRTQLENLEKRNMILNDHKPFCINKKDWQITKPNTYKTLAFEQFISNKLEYNEIPKQRKINAERYAKEIGFVNQEEVEEQSYKKKSMKKSNNSLNNYSYNTSIYDNNGVSIPLPF